MKMEITAATFFMATRHRRLHSERVISQQDKINEVTDIVVDDS